MAPLGLVPEVADLGRMRRARHARLQAELEARDLDALLVLRTGNVAYASGARVPVSDGGRAALLRTAALVRRGAHAPELFTPYADAPPPDLDAGRVHAPLLTELDEGAAALARVLAERGIRRLAVDDLSPAMRRRLDGVELVDAGTVLGPAKVVKTPDELACIRRAQQINEEAMRAVQPLARPGVRQCELSAAFLARIFELGATGNAIDPIWQPVPRSLADGPTAAHGDVAFPTPTTDRILRDGDVVWVDTGLTYEGYASDFGRTWLVGIGRRPTPRQRDQFRRWRAVLEATLAAVRPGATGADLTRAAIAAAGDGPVPWPRHFYLVHGIGTDSAEMPLIGTDLGDAFDAAIVLEPGMVLVLEPAIWDDGAAGYRAEEIVAVTADGWAPLSDHPYDPFEP